MVGAVSDSCCGPQARGPFGSEEAQEDQKEEEEGELPVPMTTRLRKQAERQREKEKEEEQRMAETISISDGEEDVSCPSQWNVERVFSYINSLPGDLNTPVNAPHTRTNMQLENCTMGNHSGSHLKIPSTWAMLCGWDSLTTDLSDWSCCGSGSITHHIKVKKLILDLNIKTN